MFPADALYIYPSNYLHCLLWDPRQELVLSDESYVESFSYLAIRRLVLISSSMKVLILLVKV